MNCAVHADTEASGYCRNCGKAMCAACSHRVRDVLYCEDCLATVITPAPEWSSSCLLAGVNPACTRPFDVSS